MEDKAKLTGKNWFNQLSEIDKERLILDNAEVAWESVMRRDPKASFTSGALQALKEYKNEQRIQSKHND